ncbi:hypothetical protein B0H12DRAFT_1141718 [Mycena haematopus]|nr:hypothetical protein B0H12DRAFT_1141718 [Mycena haematopus]
MRWRAGMNDADALRGQGETALVKEEWEEVFWLLEKAFEASGRRTARWEGSHC